MKTFFQNLIYKLGKLFLDIGNNLINISVYDKHKPLHVQINHELAKEYKITKLNNGKYIELAFAITNKIYFISC